MRLTVKVRNAEAVVRRLETKDKNVRAALRDVVARAGERVYQSAYNLTPVDTGFMRDALRLSYHREGYSYHLGWYAEDFVGTTRERGGTTQPRPFYVPPVVFGTSHVAGRDPLTPSMEDDRAQFHQESAEAMRMPA